ncbi:MAG: hypothetical protein AMS25_15340 [Gemmatimonas sp. SM23_52]|nr:MAG: hypothetical protein AMS25_15340 [Gemmatimonas sp. SM23_52]
MTAMGSRWGRIAAAEGAAGCLSVAWLALAVPAAAQEEPPRYIEVDPMIAAETGAQPWDVHAALREVRSRFRLFGEGDRAFTSLRLVGDNRMYETNSGPGDEYYLWNGGPAICQYGTQYEHGRCHFQTFGIPIMWAAPRSEWVNYLVEGVESLRNIRGDPAGFTVLWNGEVFARPKDINAADGLVSTLLTGLVSTEDGTCRDHSQPLGGANMPAGYQLLPGSNCPETWSYGGTTWLGDRPIPPDNWVAWFNERGAEFRWNRWQVPDTLKDETRFLGNNFATYGHFNDYNRTTLGKFGEVVPGGFGEPEREGYPLGLDFYFDAFSFTIPTVANAKFWAALIVNHSEQLYGVVHDYDSLYWGIGGWPGRMSSDGDNYFLVEKGAWVSAESSDPNSPECQDADPIPLIGNTCGGFDSGRPDGFETGAHGIMILKSPIGDLRNKLFTRVGSPFYLPSHPLAGDTITFNHAVNWNYGTWGAVWNRGTDRMRFGVMSDTKENILDGSSCSDFAGGNIGHRWSTFQSNEWPDGDMCQPKAWVPGNWQYVSGRPLGAHDGQDTLHLPGCGPTDGGACPVTWRDTTWQGWSANRAGNLSQHSLGPFRLAAGDTTEIILAMYSGRDSVTFEMFTQGIYDFYLGLFAVELPPPAVTIRDLDVGAGVSLGSAGVAEVTLVWDEAAGEYVDPFLAKYADDLEVATEGTQAALLRDANPGLVERIRERAESNLGRLLVYRSCDGGSTFDADGDCRGDRLYDEAGRVVEPGWQAYRILGSVGFEEVVIDDPNAEMVIDSIVVDPLDPSVADTFRHFTCGVEPCATTELVVAPPLRNVLSTSTREPNVVSVYVPASLAAGGRASEVDFQVDTRTAFGYEVTSRDLGGWATMPFEVVPVSRVREGGFEVAFANFIQVTEWRDAVTEVLDSVAVTLEDLARVVVGDTGTTTREAALGSRTLKRSDGMEVVLHRATLRQETREGDLLTRVCEVGPGSLDPDRRQALGFVLLEEVANDTLPLLVSGRLYGDEATPGAFLASPVFPGFRVVADDRPAYGYEGQFYVAGGDTLSVDVSPTRGLDTAGSRLESVQGLTFGEYILQFKDSVFGPDAPFELGLRDPDFEPAEVDAEFDASLRARTRGTTTVTDAGAKALVAGVTGRDPAEFELVAANVPFELVSLTHDRTAELAMIDRGEAVRVLGVDPDTVSVTVDGDRWVPGDELYVIEEIEAYRTREVGGEEAIVVDEAGTPVTETRRALSFAPLVLGCRGANRTCNPVSDVGRAAAPWVLVQPGDDLHVLYYSPFGTRSRFVFSLSPSLGGEAVIEAGRSIEAQMDSIRVVPNPYILYSAYELSGAGQRLMFTHPDGQRRPVLGHADTRGPGHRCGPVHLRGHGEGPGDEPGAEEDGQVRGDPLRRSAVAGAILLS